MNLVGLSASITALLLAGVHGSDLQEPPLNSNPSQSLFARSLSTQDPSFSSQFGPGTTEFGPDSPTAQQAFGATPADLGSTSQQQRPDQTVASFPGTLRATSGSGTIPLIRRTNQGPTSGTIPAASQQPPIGQPVVSAQRTNVSLGASTNAAPTQQPAHVVPPAPSNVQSSGPSFNASSAALTTPTNTLTIEDAGQVFEALLQEISNESSIFNQRSQALLSRVNLGDRNTQATLALIERDLYPSSVWSVFIYNCACKVAVPIFKVHNCDEPALLQITDFLANGDAYLAFANDQLILETPLKRPLGLSTLSFDPSSAMLSCDWSHGEVPIEARTEFTLKIVPRKVTYDFGVGAVRLLPLDSCPLISKFFLVTTSLPYDQINDACAAFDAQVAILKNDKQLREVASALNKVPGCPSAWFGGVHEKKPIPRLFLLFNPVTEQAVIDQAPKTDATFRYTLCQKVRRH